MKRNVMALMAAVLAMPLAAQAQYGGDTSVQPGDTTWQTQQTTRTTTVEEESMMEEDTRGASLGVMADIGVMDYSNDVNRDIDPGVGYGARLDLSPLRNVGIELGYAGGVNDLDEDISTDGRLITNQVGGNLRLNIVPPRYDLPLGLRPFVFGGAWYNRIDTDNFTPGVADGINALAVPVGAGIEADINRRFLIGGRFTYNFLFNEVDGFSGRNADNWLATVNLGARIGQ